MTAERALPWLMTAIIASISGMVSAALERVSILSYMSAFIFALALVATSSAVNARWWSSKGSVIPSGLAGVPSSVIASVENAWLMAIGYGWGGLAMLSVYTLAGLKWRHGWQYGLGMLLIAALIAVLAHFIARQRTEASRSIRIATLLTILQGLACTAGLGYLIGSGKMLSLKDDWAANHIFFTGSLALIGLSWIAVYTRYYMRQREPVILDGV